MSERMIELQRAKMGLPMKTAQNVNIASKDGKGGKGGSGSSNDATEKSTSIPKVYAQDEKICTFLHKLQHTKPTVPPSLTRRILNKQGVGYSDPLVSTIVSSAADRFLATVLSQALVCRDRRLKGEELARKNKRELERSKKRRRAEQLKIDGKRQKLEKELEDFATNVKGGTGGSGAHSKKDSRKLSPALASIVEKGGLDAHFKTDSIHDEEKHYEALRDNTNDDNNDKDKTADDANTNENPNVKSGNESYEEDESDIDDSDDEDDDRDILHLRDLVRPLEAWGMSLTGKILATEQAVRVPKEKTIADNDDENLVLEGEDAVGDEEDEDMNMAIADASGAGIGAGSSGGEKTPARRKKAATPKPKPSPKNGGRSSPLPPSSGKNDGV